MNLSSYPHLVKEWHPTKNGDLTPDDFTHGTLKKVWWLCPKGHSYNGPVARRTAKKPSGCPYCAGKKASAENSLISLFPDVAKEWHPLRNSKLKLNEMTYGSKKKAWWLCPNGHNYETMIIHRTVHNSGCPYCSGHKPSKNNNLSALFPEIAKEWHPTKNGKLIPKKVTSKANKKVWWLCPKGHSYESLIGSRTGQNTGCPYCSGLIASESNNLLAIFPNIAQEWHPTKNHNLKPSDLSYGSNKKVWWLCDKGHDYKTSPHIRTGQKSGCPFCINHSSQPEIRILSELKWIFEEVNSRYKINKTEIDVYIPQFNLGIEYDGSFWHKNKEDKDLKKNNNLLSYGINLIRVRHHPLKPISKNDVIATKETLDKNDLNSLVKKVESFVDLITKKKINTYLTKSSFVNEDLFKKYEQRNTKE